MQHPHSHPRPGYLIHRAARLFMRINDSRLKPQKVVSGQIPVLILLSKSGPMTQTALAKAADVEQPSMAQLLTRMERDDLIYRTLDPADRRSSLIHLTANSQEIVSKVSLSLDYVNEQAYKGLTEQERESFTMFLLRVIANLEAVTEAGKLREG